MVDSFDWDIQSGKRKKAFDSRLDGDDFRLLWLVSENSDPKIGVTSRTNATLEELSGDPFAPKLDKVTIWRRLKRLKEDGFLDSKMVPKPRGRDQREYSAEAWLLTWKGQMAALGVIAFQRELLAVLPRSRWGHRPDAWFLLPKEHPEPHPQKGTLIQTSMQCFLEVCNWFFDNVNRDPMLKAALVSSNGDLSDLSFVWEQAARKDLDALISLAEKHGMALPGQDQYRRLRNSETHFLTLVNKNVHKSRKRH